MKKQAAPTTNLCQVFEDRIVVRDHDLVSDLMGQRSFTEVLFLLLSGRLPSDGEKTVLDAVLVTLMEHGFTPQAIATRAIYRCEPGSIQGAMAAGLLGVGGVFAGTMADTALLLEEILAASSHEEAARNIVARYRSARKSIPGFGHPHHRPDDPRSARLFEIAERSQVKGDYIAAIKLLAREVDAAFGKHLTINATGAIGAVLSEIGIPASVMRGIAVVSRAGGLLGHIREEQTNPAMPLITDLVSDAVPYRSDD